MGGCLTILEYFVHVNVPISYTNEMSIQYLFIPREVIAQEVTAHFQGPEDVITDLSQELTVFSKGLWVGVTAFVCTKLQQNCGDVGKTEKKEVGRAGSKRNRRK